MLADKFIGKTGRTVEEFYGIIEDNIKELREYYDEKVTRKYSDRGPCLDVVCGRVCNIAVHRLVC